MRQFLFLLLVWIPLHLFGQEDYTIEINNDEYQISLNKSYDFEVDGKKISLLLKMNDILFYNDSIFSFNYAKEYKISKVVIDEGIEQIMILSAEGSGFAIQKYLSMNPTMLNEMIIREVTKESVSYGYEMKREDYIRELRTGEKLSVSKAVLTYNSDKSIYEVASYGKKDEGLIVMTIITNESMSQHGQKIIDLMWKSLSFK